MYKSLQGRVNFGLRQSNGKPGAMWFVGNVPEATIQLQSQSTTKKESHTGQRLPAEILFTGQEGTFNLTLDEWLTKNLAEAFYGVSADIAGGSVTGEAFPDDLVDGDMVRLDLPYATSLVISDSATPTPATVDPSKYQLVGHNARMVEMLDVAGFTQPFVGAYTNGAAVAIEAFLRQPRELFVQFDGIDTLNDEPVSIDIYRVRFSPIQNIQLIHNEFGAMQLQGSVLYDPLNDDGSTTAGFMRLTQQAAA